MDLHLKDKVVIVTGGARGIGEAVVRAFAEEGALPVILGRNFLAGEALVQDLTEAGHQAAFFEVELTDLDALNRAVDEIRTRHGSISGVVNNAGVNDGVGLDATPEAFVESLHKNIVHCFALVRHALEDLKGARGFIINVGSKVAETGQGGTSGYAASKGAMNALTREWALDLASHGIRVNTVIPAEVMTPMYRSWLDSLENPQETQRAIEERIPLGRRMTTAREIADAVVFLASERSGHTTGQIVFVDGGYTHFDRAYGRIEHES